MRRAFGRGGLLPLGLLVVAIALAGVAALSKSADAGSKSSTTAPTSCDLGPNISHVINIVFDNVHFARDNPNVPSDLELMPHLMSFLKGNGTIFSNTHTPMIAHTADDSLSIYTGLYGDRHGQPLSNSFKTFNSDGSTDPATSFTYWTSPVVDTKFGGPTAGHDATPSMVYSDHVPVTAGDTSKITPAPWVPFTRAGCSVGDFSTANMVLENAKGDLPTVFGANSPEVNEFNSSSSSATTDYIGDAVHCAQGDALCADAQAVKFGRTTPELSAQPDLLPTEPGGYDGYQALFGAKYVAPQLGLGTPNKMNPTNEFPVTNSSGQLVDLNGNVINGFPGFSPTAPQTLAELADMQEAGIPVTYGYISDLHERKNAAAGCTSATPQLGGRPLGPGDACYIQNAISYDNAFKTFFDRLAADGIDKTNTLFVISAEENDQFAGANANRASKPSPAGCDGATVDNTALTVTPDVACNYLAAPTQQIGELQANPGALLSTTASKNTQFDIEPQGAAIYVHGQPAANDAAVRQLERDTAAWTNPSDPYSGATNEKITQYQAGALEQRVLHMQTADPLRTPTYTLFPKPDYFFGTTTATPADPTTPTVTINNGFAYDHGYYSPNIDITWVGMVGPGVANRQIDGPTPAGGNEASDPESTKTVPQASQNGTWVEETDIRPTMLHLLGLTDDYQSDGHVVTQALTSVPTALAATADLAKGYDQINSSVGQFATDTLIADSKALAGGSASDDSAYATEQTTLQQLADDRDQAATTIKQTLSNAEAGIVPSNGALQSGLAHVKELLKRAHTLASQ